MPGLFVGFNTKYSEPDSVRSPTSPLDFRIFSSRGNTFRNARSNNDGHLKSWDCGKLGLRLVDSLDHGTNTSGASSMLSDNKNIFFGRQMTVRGYNFDTRVSAPELPNSLPEHVAIPPGTAKKSELENSDSSVIFEIGEVADESMICKGFCCCSVESGFGNSISQNKLRTVLSDLKLAAENESLYKGKEASVQSEAGFICSVPASEIELSEDYTCVRKYGSNPKVTHIFGDCIFEVHNGSLYNTMMNHKCDISTATDAMPRLLKPYPLNDFLKVCHYCNKNLDGEDVYLYRGEMGFCSNSCRFEVMKLDEDIENAEIDFLEMVEKPRK